MTTSTQTWSDETKERTIRAINNFDFLFVDDKVHFKNINGHYGYILIENISHNLVIVDKRTATEVLYKNTLDLIKDGWVLD